MELLIIPELLGEPKLMEVKRIFEVPLIESLVGGRPLLGSPLPLNGPGVDWIVSNCDSDDGGITALFDRTDEDDATISVLRML